MSGKRAIQFSGIVQQSPPRPRCLGGQAWGFTVDDIAGANLTEVAGRQSRRAPKHGGPAGKSGESLAGVIWVRKHTASGPIAQLVRARP